MSNTISEEHLRDKAKEAVDIVNTSSNDYDAFDDMLEMFSKFVAEQGIGVTKCKCTNCGCGKK
jgi:hypothetical protein